MKSHNYGAGNGGSTSHIGTAEPGEAGEAGTPAEHLTAGLVGKAEQYAQAEPVRALGVAFLVGLVLTVLPIGGLIALLVRLTLTLVRPLLLVLGAVKLYEEIDRRSGDKH